MDWLPAEASLLTGFCEGQRSPDDHQEDKEFKHAASLSPAVEGTIKINLI